MKLSVKCLLGLVAAANLLTADFAAASGFRRSSSSSGKSSSIRSPQSSSRFTQPKTISSKSRFTSPSPIAKRNPAIGSTVKRNPVVGSTPVTRIPVTQTPVNRLPVTKSPILTRPVTSPVTVRQPIVGKGPITVRNPVIGNGPVQGRLPVQSGDPDAGSPVKPRPVQEAAAVLPGRGEQLADKVAPINDGKELVPGTERPDVRRPEESSAGNFQEGDVVAGNGKVVDQEFLDLVNDGEFLHTGQPAPWDNPEDPFWYGEKPVDWKGHWPGKEAAPGNDPLPGKDPLPGNDPLPGKDPLPGNDPFPGKDPNPGEGPRPDENPVPGEEPNPGNDGAPEPGHDDNHDCPPTVICPPPVIIIDPTRPCLTPCPPCVAVVCRPCLPVVGQPIVEEPQPAVLQLIVGMDNPLDAQGLGNVKGAAALEVNGLGLPVPVTTWTNEQLVLSVPTIGLSQPTPAKLFLFDAQRQVLAEIPVELLTPEMAGIDREALKAPE